MGSIYNDFKPNQTNNMSNFISQFNQFAETANQLRSLLK